LELSPAFRYIFFVTASALLRPQQKRMPLQSGLGACRCFSYLNNHNIVILKRIYNDRKQKFWGENSPPLEGWQKFERIFDGVVSTAFPSPDRNGYPAVAKEKAVARGV